MSAVINERLFLKEAMQYLTVGDSRRFCDLLWLGFGDAWRPILADLVSRQLVSFQMTNEGEQFEITPRGRSWTQQFAVNAMSAA